MVRDELRQLAERHLAAWNSQDIERVLGCYTEDLVYRDPNTRGEVRSPDGMRRYLKKLFAAWVMHWSVREVFPLATEQGCAFLWRGSFRKADGTETVELDGMDLVLLKGERIQRNDVYFDRAGLAKLLGFPSL